MNRELIGVFPLWKPKGMTSFSAVREVGKRFGTKKAGHTGTLDPDVEGVLPICLGRATKIVEYLTANDKTYVGEVTLGYTTTTEDASGEKVREVEVDRLITEDEVANILSNLIGTLDQTPPMYSAVKVNGRKLYEYARKGIEIERPSRTITIYELELVKAPSKNQDGTVSFSFRAVCSKGTYIRTLSVMIGEKLGFPAHMSFLVRDSSGPFHKNDCITLDQLDEAVAKKIEDQLLIPVETALSMFPIIEVNELIEERVLQGSIISIPDEKSDVDESTWALYNKQGKCLALYKRDTNRPGKMKPEKMIRTIQNKQ